MLKKFTRYEIALLVFPIALIGFGGYLQRTHQNTLSRDLQKLADVNAVRCDRRECEVAAFREKRPFWTRNEVPFCQIMHAGRSREYPAHSEARVYTAQGEIYEFTYYPARGLQGARINKEKWVRPYLSDWPHGEWMLRCKGIVEVE